jgi:hypothetical protein
MFAGFPSDPYGTPHAALARMRSATRPVREMTARSPILTDPHQNGHTNMTTTSATGALAAVLADALTESGRTLADLTVAEAIELADGLRAFVAALPTPSPFDVRLATALKAAADLIEQRTGTG